ncbi:hypothetical protein KC345_g3173 [Hortaea werneckii]|nr:hypothetical protein KC345_g3173 [Hortaea werneckii]
MASVTSLDQDMRNLRLGRYTPQAANEARQWIEDSLGEPLSSRDLLDALKDGIVLCKLANLVLPPPGVKFKTMAMPFIQMENISHFLKACEMPPLNLPAHDRFLTVDLYEQKDPAQVLQCLGAFSRQAHVARPDIFKTTIGPAKKSGSVVSPTNTGRSGGLSNGGGSWRGSVNSRPGSPTKSVASPSAAVPSSSRAMSPNYTGGSTGSAGSTPSTTKSPGPVSSWSSRRDEGVTNPAWNIAQYGYMGGASQGNQGVVFGGRRQITSAGPSVPNSAAIVRKRQEEEQEQQRLKQQAEEAEYKRKVEREANEERERLEEERHWEAETKRQRDEERQRLAEQKRQWEEQERRWKEEEEVRRKEEADVQAKLMPKKPPEKPRVSSQSILRGQSLADYQRSKGTLSNGGDGSADESPEQRRVRELEQQLEEARERERQYQTEREERMQKGIDRGSRPGTADATRPGSAGQSDVSWAGDEREFLRSQWEQSQHEQQQQQQQQSHQEHYRSPSPTPQPSSNESTAPGAQSPPASSSTRPLPQPATVEEAEDPEADTMPTLPSRPQSVQQANSSSSVPRFDGESAPNSSPLGSNNRPLPTPDKEYRPYTPEQPKPSSFGAGFGSVRGSPFTRPGQGSRTPELPNRDIGSVRSPFARPERQTTPEIPSRSSGTLRSPFARPADGARPSSPFARPQEARSPFARPTSRAQEQHPAGAVVEQTPPANRTDDYLASHSAPQEQEVRVSSSQEAGDTTLEQQRDRDRRMASQQKTKAGGWASKSLLEREMERERERQREWEANQQEVQNAPKDPNAGSGQGQSWDVNQYGFMGGDNQSRGSSAGSGINFGGRRQILGPRPQK